MVFNEFTQKEIEYEFLYNLRDQTLLFMKLSDGKYVKELLEWLDSSTTIIARELEQI